MRSAKTSLIFFVDVNDLLKKDTNLDDEGKAAVGDGTLEWIIIFEQILK